MAGADALELLNDIITRARRAGADAADAVRVESRALSVSRRLDRPEAVERAEAADIGLRVLVGRRQAVVSTTDTGPESLAELAARAVAMARAAPEDRYAGLAEPGQTAETVPAIDMFDPAELSVEELAERARAAEAAARAVPGITNSEGAEAGWSRTEVALAASNGFAGGYRRSGFGLSAVMLAGSGQAMERDYEFTSATHLADLADAETVGRRAGERAVRRLNARRPPTGRVPVVFDPRVSHTLIGHFAAAVNGAAIARGTSFLKDAMNEQVFAPGVSVTDDPLRPRGLRSRPFDGEGLAAVRRAMVVDGRLASWFLDLAAARQLGLASTGHAGRGTSAPPAPSPSNLWLEAGAQSPEALIAGIDRGLYVHELMGMSVNIVTGDYSRGGAGFWIENGELAWPVSGLTVAGNLRDIFATLTPANDLTHRYGTDAPTLQTEALTVAGEG